MVLNAVLYLVHAELAHIHALPWQEHESTLTLEKPLETPWRSEILYVACALFESVSNKPFKN